MLNWIKQKWDTFEAWVNSVLPGFKTKLTQLMGLIGAGSAAFYSYIQGIPLEQVMKAKTALIIGSVLFTLSYWFKDMGTRVESRVDTSA